MVPEYLSFMGSVIALAPLEVSTALHASPHDCDRAQYWRYMTQAGHSCFRRCAWVAPRGLVCPTAAA